MRKGKTVRRKKREKERMLTREGNDGNDRRRETNDGRGSFTDGRTSQRIAGKEKKSSSSPVIFVP